MLTWRPGNRIVGASQIQIQTLEGSVVASNGDWIIRGVEGELYPCRSDIFEKTYEEIK
jgi:hypothetical protein